MNDLEIKQIFDSGESISGLFYLKYRKKIEACENVKELERIQFKLQAEYKKTCEQYKEYKFVLGCMNECKLRLFSMIKRSKRLMH